MAIFPRGQLQWKAEAGAHHHRRQPQRSTGDTFYLDWRENSNRCSDRFRAMFLGFSAKTGRLLSAYRSTMRTSVLTPHVNPAGEVVSRMKWLGVARRHGHHLSLAIATEWFLP